VVSPACFAAPRADRASILLVPSSNVIAEPTCATFAGIALE
jgi:hypothetical protein